MTTDLIKQMDGVFTKLNSNTTEKVITSISTNIKQMLINTNSENSRELTKNIFNNINEFFITINSNNTKDILNNLGKLTKNSKIYIDVNDNNWNVNKLMIYLEIILLLIIVIMVFLLSICVYKIFKKKKHLESFQIPLYNPLDEHEQILKF